VREQLALEKDLQGHIGHYNKYFLPIATPEGLNAEADKIFFILILNQINL
jgi:hypothetical protein